MVWDWYNSSTIMEYHKIIKFLDNTANHTSKFRTKNWIGINDNSYGTCDHVCIYTFKGTITIQDKPAETAGANNTNKKVIFKNFASFTDCISEINNTQVDNAKDIDIVMSMYNLIEYCDDYLKISGGLW